ncbi:acyl carrier protein (plasmid) [Ralstonia solanacearum]|uniref:acyl carrier protein n=1 Tax=Ralstonia pseudosolanacearum TaxID=1310165 RepID=UPI0008F82540|nr:acyl carrier protein [Ralstonia pseudosolanacearum]APC67111.1 acyl carrier protein [Ralstonia solanacearum OE1-1]NKA10138.1 acyl carrier protein [Ralstonia solanacearum]API76666.1 acyl carrier protein [Ralstonia pseudosolanacearum]ASL75877.1 acyl carrier protein [Ralstonia pseudosolanacearum]MCK4117466.1 acyl carrier protein [Ralstonia pseudosolanacearum]
MSNPTVLDQIRHIIAQALDKPVETIRAEQSFRRDLGADSLDSVEIVIAIEDQFAVEFDEDSTAAVDTVQDLVTYIEAALASRGAQTA